MKKLLAAVTVLAVSTARQMRDAVTTRGIVCCLCLLGTARAVAGPISLGDIAHPVIEPFEGIIGVTVPPGLFSGGMYGAPPAGLTLPSGLIFVEPDPNPPDGQLFIIGDYLFGDGGYGLLDNGFIVSPADLRSGTAFAGAGAPFIADYVFKFEFPLPALNFGVFASASTFKGDPDITLTTYTPSGALIESFTFLTVPVPLDDANFIGLGGEGPIGSFEISSNNFFVFDDVIWERVTECLTGVSVEIVCHADGTTFTVNVEGLNACTGGTTQVTFTASGGAVGEELCFTVVVDDGGFCCTTEICVTIPDCTPAALPSDLDGDGIVGMVDFLAMLGAWGSCSDCGTPAACPADLDGDCSVGILDLLILLGNWGVF